MGKSQYNRSMDVSNALTVIYWLLIERSEQWVSKRKRDGDYWHCYCLVINYFVFFGLDVCSFFFYRISQFRTCVDCDNSAICINCNLRLHVRMYARHVHVLNAHQTVFCCMLYRIKKKSTKTKKKQKKNKKNKKK